MKTMITLLTETLTQLKVAKVQVHSFSVRKQVNLFESELAPEISFNGYKLTSDYHIYLDSLYHECKSTLEESLNNDSTNPEVLKRELDLFRFEVREFKNRYFPRENEQVIFNRVEFVKTPLTNINDDAGLKKKFQTFLPFNRSLSKCLTNCFFTAFSI